MFELILFDEKTSKKRTKEFQEIDLVDLLSYSSSLEFVNEFNQHTSSKIGNKLIVEWFELNGISLWWFVQPTIYPHFNNACMFIDQFLNFLKKNPTKKIKLKGCFDKLDIIKQICKLNNIFLNISKIHYLLFKLKLSKHIFENQAYRKITYQKHNKRLKCFKNKKRNFTFNSNSTIITSPGLYRREFVEVSTEKITKQEFFIQPILELLKNEKISTLCFDLDYTFHGETKALNERLDSDYNWMPIEILIKLPKNKLVKNSIKNLKNSVNIMINIDNEDKFSYRGISTWKYLKPLFKKIFYEPYLPTYIHLIHELEVFLKEIDPRVIIQTYETGPYAKSFEVVAKKLGIRTIGIQHGIFHENGADYFTRALHNENNPLGDLIPDKTLVFGEHFKKILIEKTGYPKDKVDVIGNPIFFEIEKIKKIVPALIRKKNQLDGEKIILVPLSFRLFSGLENNKEHLLLNYLFKEMKNDENIIFLIRPHPSDFSHFTEMLKKKYPSNNFIPSKSSLIEDILVSDIVVLATSSVGLDSIVFEKPVIFVNPTDSDSTFDALHQKLFEKNVATTCKINELVSKISIINKENFWTEERIRNRNELLKYFYNIGNSTNLLNLIFK